MFIPTLEFSKAGIGLNAQACQLAIHFWIPMASNVSSSHGMSNFMKVSELGALKVNNTRIRGVGGTLLFP